MMILNAYDTRVILFLLIQLFFQAEADLKAAKAELKKAKSLLQLDELKCRKRVLRRLGYCDESDVISRKVSH